MAYLIIFATETSFMLAKTERRDVCV